MRAITEILIWGDQNDAAVFEFVLFVLFQSKHCIQFLFGTTNVLTFPADHATN
jgi:hypothetical protein